MSGALSERVKQALRAVPDFPKPGILFQDITPLLGDAGLFADVIAGLAAPFQSAGITHILGIEARGFIFGAAVAHQMGVGFIPARKPGKLPWEAVRQSYQLEYGTDALEAHRDACPGKARLLIIDDVLATGGTAQAAGELVRGLGGELAGWSFLLELGFLSGRARLAGAPASAILTLT
jgi:adenine phosphoribosyltransferase